ncbi:histidine phosphatase family protein [Paenibacillus gansuensis]|uniref:Histidine phosphatase family protein n=1 Tax=Paenibacillus gansuensis TaxID=306542 RepID=A0ABW5PC36_9BACL
MSTIGFIRHGVTRWNAEGRLQGQIDIELSGEGVAQAEALASRLAAESWDCIYSSDLQRARGTAEIIANRMGLKDVLTDIRLRERSFGKLEGTTLDERVAAWGSEWQSLDLGVESDEALTARALEFIEELTEIHPHSRILIVSHGGYLAQLYKTVFLEHEDEHLTNTSLTIAVREGGTWIKTLFNCTAHLHSTEQPT